MQEFADVKLYFAKMMISFFDILKKKCGKMRKYWLPPFSPFPAMFSNDFFLKVVKRRDCVVELKRGWVNAFGAETYGHFNPYQGDSYRYLFSRC